FRYSEGLNSHGETWRQFFYQILLLYGSATIASHSSLDGNRQFCATTGRTIAGEVFSKDSNLIVAWSKGRHSQDTLASYTMLQNVCDYVPEFRGCAVGANSAARCISQKDRLGSGRQTVELDIYDRHLKSNRRLAVAFEHLVAHFVNPKFPTRGI